MKLFHECHFALPVGNGLLCVSGSQDRLLHAVFTAFSYICELRLNGSEWLGKCEMIEVRSH